MSKGWKRKRDERKKKRKARKRRAKIEAVLARPSTDWDARLDFPDEGDEDEVKPLKLILPASLLSV